MELYLFDVYKTIQSALYKFNKITWDKKVSNINKEMGHKMSQNCVYFRKRKTFLKTDDILILCATIRVSIEILRNKKRRE